MKTFIFLTLFFSAFIANAQLANTIQSVVGSTFTEKEAVDGIKEALKNGTTNVVKVVSVTDGFFKNTEIKIPFPKEVKVIETKLRAAGLGKQVDEAVKSLNRAAEDASKTAQPIIVNAITKMTIPDAISVVKGSNDAATNYLKKTSTAELTTKFKPIVKSSLNKVGATKYWTDLITAYNKIPFVTKLNPDLAQYVTEKAISGVFVMLAKEELKIRKDPKARVSELLEKVF
jgi:hypothetical protein